MNNKIYILVPFILFTIMTILEALNNYNFGMTWFGIIVSSVIYWFVLGEDHD